MFFTTDDIQKISKGLVELGIKDTQLPNTEYVIEQDSIAIVQDGENKKVFVRDFLNSIGVLKKSDFLNVSALTDNTYINIDEVIHDIPASCRKPGLCVTFQNTNYQWKIYQFRGEKNQWDVHTFWIDILDDTQHVIDSILPDEEDLTKSLPDEQGNSYLSLKDRDYDPNNFSGKGYKILRKNLKEVIVTRTSIIVNAAAGSEGTITIAISGIGTEVSLTAEDNTVEAVAKKIATSISENEKMSGFIVSYEGSTVTVENKFTLNSAITTVGKTATGAVVYATDEDVKVTKNILKQLAISQPNTTYEIRYDFDLFNTTINIPEGCVLKFEGGSLKNGKLVGYNTYLSDKILLDSIVIDGTYTNTYSKASYFRVSNKDNSSNVINLLKISKNLIIDTNNYTISKTLYLPYESFLTCDVGSSIKMSGNGCIYLAWHTRIQDFEINVGENLKNTKHLIVIDLSYIYKSIENLVLSYPSLLDIYIDRLKVYQQIKQKRVTIEKIIDIFSHEGKGGWNINISNCVLECKSTKAIYLETGGESKSWVNGVYFNNIRITRANTGFYIGSIGEVAVPPESITITQCSMQCEKDTSYFIEAAATHRLYVFYCEPWDWHKVDHNPFLFTEKCEGVNVISSGAFGKYDFKGDRTSTINTINYMAGSHAVNINAIESLPSPKNGEVFSLKEIQTLPRGVYKVPSDSAVGKIFAIPTPLGGMLIIDGGRQGSVLLTYYDNRQCMYVFSVTTMLTTTEDRAIRGNDWYSPSILSTRAVDTEDSYIQYKFYKDTNRKPYYKDYQWTKDCLGRQYLVQEVKSLADTSTFTNADRGRVLYDNEMNASLIMWDGKSFVDSEGYSASYRKKGTSYIRPSVSLTEGGFTYYDTSLQKRIVWDGTQWLNPDGSTVDKVTIL